VKFAGFVVPGLRTRRAKTGVELRDGQSFALAGLLNNDESRSLAKTPILGDIPILGSLFRSKSFQKDETELMFVVTAQLVKPVNPDDLPRWRGVDGLKNGSPLGVESKGEGINGKSGFSTGASENAPAAAPRMPAKQESAPATTTKPQSTPATSSVSSVDGERASVLAEEPPPMPATVPAQAKNEKSPLP
jgi:pilus assembly protein CpaC